MINLKDISVVVQGVINKTETLKCLKSIRKHLPDAEIILSTWIGENIDGLIYDKLVLNEDPGATIQNFTTYTYNNTNRQLLSTQSALEQVTNKYVLKLRTDAILKGTKFLKYWNKFETANKNYKIFKHRVIISSLYSRLYSDSDSNVPMPFHPSDFYFFGLKEDIKDYFLNTVLATDEELGNWQFKNPDRLPYKNTLFRYSPEQYICFHWLQKHYKDIQFDDLTDWNIQNIEFSKNILFNNFIFLDFNQCEIYVSKHNCNPNNILGIISYDKFIKEYKKISNIIAEDKPNQYYKQKLINHYMNFINPFKDLFIWFSEIFSIIYYTTKIILERFK